MKEIRAALSDRYEALEKMVKKERDHGRSEGEYSWPQDRLRILDGNDLNPGVITTFVPLESDANLDAFYDQEAEEKVNETSDVEPAPPTVEPGLLEAAVRKALPEILREDPPAMTDADLRRLIQEEFGRGGAGHRASFAHLDGNTSIECIVGGGEEPFFAFDDPRLSDTVEVEELVALVRKVGAVPRPQIGNGEERTDEAEESQAPVGRHDTPEISSFDCVTGRTSNALARAGIQDVAQLLEAIHAEGDVAYLDHIHKLSDLEGVGAMALRHVKRVLEAVGVEVRSADQRDASNEVEKQVEPEAKAVESAPIPETYAEEVHIVLAGALGLERLPSIDVVNTWELDQLESAEEWARNTGTPMPNFLAAAVGVSREEKPTADPEPAEAPAVGRRFVDKTCAACGEVETRMSGVTSKCNCGGDMNEGPTPALEEAESKPQLRDRVFYSGDPWQSYRIVEVTEDGIVGIISQEGEHFFTAAGDLAWDSRRRCWTTEVLKPVIGTEAKSGG